MKSKIAIYKIMYENNRSKKLKIQDLMGFNNKLLFSSSPNPSSNFQLYNWSWGSIKTTRKNEF